MSPGCLGQLLGSYQQGQQAGCVNIAPHINKLYTQLCAPVQALALSPGQLLGKQTWAQ